MLNKLKIKLAKRWLPLVPLKELDGYVADRKIVEALNNWYADATRLMLEHFKQFDDLGKK